MKQLFFSLVLMLCSLTAHGFDERYWRQTNVASTETINHQAWSDILAAHLRVNKGVNLFDYSGLIADKSATGLNGLFNYVQSLQQTSVTRLRPQEQFAYWVNLYNAVTILEIVDNYPVDSIRVISSGLFSLGPWKKDLMTVEGRKLTLDNVEHDILRANYSDNRIHYALNCAAIGCPSLQPQAFTASNLEAMLDKAAREYVNDPRGVTVSSKGLVVSKIYDWYEEDFGDSEINVIKHLTQYASESLKQQLSRFNSIDSYEYDWSINEAR